MLRELQDSQSQLTAHQHLGLAEIQRLAGLGELFDTLLVFENYPVDARLAEPVGGLQPAGLGGRDAPHYPLSLAVVPGERVLLRFDYRPDLFDRGSVERLGERFVRLLEAAVCDPERSIGRLEILSAGERHTILCDWNDTAHAVPAATLPQLFDAQVARSPQAIAVVCEEASLSYGALDGRANQLAHHLRGLGVGPEVVVGLCVERSLEMVVGLIGILKAGGAICRSTRAIHRIVSPSCWRTPVLPWWSPSRGWPIVWPPTTGCSGSMPTGRALRVTPPRRQPTGSIRKTPPMSSTRRGPLEGRRGSAPCMEASSASSRLVPTWSSRETTLYNAPFAFDASTFEVWGPLLSGARLVLMPGGQWTLPHLRQHIERHQVSWLQISAALFNALAREDYPGFSAIEQLFIGTDVVSYSQACNILTALERCSSG